MVSDVSLGGPALSEAAAAYGHLLLLGPAMAGYFATPSQMPGALIEPLFITDPFEGVHRRQRGRPAGHRHRTRPGRRPVLRAARAQPINHMTPAGPMVATSHQAKPTPRGRAFRRPTHAR